MTLEASQVNAEHKLPPDAMAGIEQADANAIAEWKQAIDRSVRVAANKKREITTDDVLLEFELLHASPRTYTMRAIGPAMIRAADEGIITRTDRVRRSERDGNHGNWQKIWLSNRYRPQHELFPSTH